MTATSEPQQARRTGDGSAPGEKGLTANAISYVSNVVIATASTAPAYSLAATLGFIVAVPGDGKHAADGPQMPRAHGDRARQRRAGWHRVMPATGGGRAVAAGGPGS